MAKLMSGNWDTILAIGAVIAGGYLIYRLSKPLTETVGTVGQTIGGTGQNILKVQSEGVEVAQAGGGAIQNLIGVYDDILKKIRTGIQGLGTKEENTTLLKVQSKPTVTTGNYVTNVKQGSGYYGGAVRTQLITTSQGNVKEIVQKPGTYYSDVGIGFNEQGAGYSSAFPLNSSKTTNSALKSITGNTIKTISPISQITRAKNSPFA